MSRHTNLEIVNAITIYFEKDKIQFEIRFAKKEPTTGSSHVSTRSAKETTWPLDVLYLKGHIYRHETRCYLDDQSIVIPL